MNKPSLKLRIKRSQFLLGDALEWLAALPDKHFGLAITSPPYNIGKAYEIGKRWTLEEYLKFVESVVALLIPKIADTGSVCWQVENQLNRGEVFPLDTTRMTSFSFSRYEIA